MQKQIVRRAKVDDNHLPNNLHPLIKQIYASRGIESATELELNVSKLCAIGSLKGINQGCQVLHQALLDNKSIAIIGDFDADGATSTALMMEALRLFGSDNYQFIVPNRFLYGYGLTPEIVEIAAGKGAELLITVDNGISCVAGVTKAKSLGLGVIVTDHHLPGTTLPDADAIINPNQVGCDFPSKALAGVGVAFYFMMAMRKYLREKNWFVDKQIEEPNIAQLLDLVALGTLVREAPSCMFLQL